MKKTVLMTIIVSVLALGAFGLPQKRTALVIGNADYQSSPLRNPVNDAQAMEFVLKELGFEVITAYDVPTLQQFGKLVKTYGNKLREGGVGLFYYAGHGVQYQGNNYLMPTQANIEKEEDIEFEGFDLDKLLAEVQSAKNDLNIIILDACRDNPYASGFRTAQRGLANIERNIPDVLIAFSTQPNGVASDGDGKNGIFTEELIKVIRNPGLSISQVMMNVRDNVKTRTNSKQLPWETNLLTREFYFIPSGTKPSPKLLSGTIRIENKSGMSWKTQKWVATGLTVLTAGMCLYCNNQSEFYYDKYKNASLPSEATKYRNKTNDFDNYTLISGVIIPVPLTWCVFAWWKDSRK